MASALKKLIRRFRRDAEGVTIVEFAFIGPVLMIIIMGIVEIGLMMGAQGMLDNVAFMASRVGKTGYSNSGSTQAATISAAVTKAASGYLDPSKIVITSQSYLDYDKIGQPEPFTDLNANGKRDPLEPYTDVNGNGAYDTDQGQAGYGATGSVTLYTITYNWDLRSPFINKFIGTNGKVALKSRIVVKNEPF